MFLDCQGRIPDFSIFIQRVTERPQKEKATVTQVAGNTGVVVRRVTFPRSNDITLVGNLLLPKQFDAFRRYPVILCVHPAGSVKEESAGLYAHLLAQQSFTTLAFDTFTEESEKNCCSEQLQSTSLDCGSSPSLV